MKQIKGSLNSGSGLALVWLWPGCVAEGCKGIVWGIFKGLSVDLGHVDLLRIKQIGGGGVLSNC